MHGLPEPTEIADNLSFCLAVFALLVPGYKIIIDMLQKGTIVPLFRDGIVEMHNDTFVRVL